MLIKTPEAGNFRNFDIFLWGNANKIRRRQGIVGILTFSYREMLMKTAGGGGFLNFEHFPIGQC